MNNIIITLKNSKGKNPSRKNPVYYKVGDVTRKIDKPLSVTRNAGENWLKPPLYRRILCFLGLHRYLHLDFYGYLGEDLKGNIKLDFVPAGKRCLYCDKAESG